MKIPTPHVDPAERVFAPEFSGATDPFTLFETWFSEAEAREVNDPNAMALATVDASGMPNVRMMLLKGLDESSVGEARGFVFYTNYESAKGQELLASSKAALLFHWKSLRRQVRVRGMVAQTTGAEADAYFASRSRGSRVGVWASQQSRPLEGRSELEQAFAKMDKRFEGGDVPRPAHWSGFRLTPLEIEFWDDRPLRLHERLLFRRSAPAQAWRKSGLFP